jgi:hypothetical protein
VVLSGAGRWIVAGLSVPVLLLEFFYSEKFFENRFGLSELISECIFIPSPTYLSLCSDIT